MPFVGIVGLMVLGRRLHASQNVLFGHSDYADFILKKRMTRLGYYTVNPIYVLLTKLQVTPNQITSLGLMLTIAAAFVFALTVNYLGVMMFVSAGWLICLGGICDFIDGMLAKLNNQHTKAGSFYDSVIDRFSEAAMFTGLAWFYRDNFGLILVLLAFTGSMVTSYCRSAGEKFGVIYKSGIMQRTGRVALLGFGAVFTPYVASLLHLFFPDDFAFSIATCSWIYLFPIGIVALLANVTAVQRTAVIFDKLKIQS